jgi:hypothetical protein
MSLCEPLPKDIELNAANLAIIDTDECNARLVRLDGNSLQFILVGLGKREDVVLRGRLWLRCVFQVNADAIIDTERAARNNTVNANCVDCSELRVLRNLCQRRSMLEVVVVDLHAMRLLCSEQYLGEPT